MFERHAGGEKALLVALDFGEPDFLDSTEELQRLAESAGLDIAGLIKGKRSRPDPRYFVGSGKAEEIGFQVAAAGAEVVIFNHELSPAQERNLEKLISCRVVDRVSLILDIFARRAQSAEGKLQVELAQLAHLSTRLVRGWTHLERQKGGIGLRGPGETQLETDRRLIGKRVKLLKARLEKLEKQREVQRRARARNQVFSVTVVGYTNAGKSTLFNALTRAGVYAADQLFATVDTTSRKLYLSGCGEVVLSDTVGFITQLPHELIAAFHATLEAATRADLLLHVVDGASPIRDHQIDEVDQVLQQIGASQIAQLQVLNKIDLTRLEPGIERDEYGKMASVRVSARTGAGLDLLRQAIVEAANSHRAGGDLPDDNPSIPLSISA